MLFNELFKKFKVYVLAMLGVADVVWWANYGVAVVTASSVETSLIRTTHSRSGAFVDIFKEFFVKLCNRIY